MQTNFPVNDIKCYNAVMIYSAPGLPVLVYEGFTEDQKTKTPRITDEGWNFQKQLSDPVEKKMKERKKTPVSSSKALSRFSSPIGYFTE